MTFRELTVDTIESFQRNGLPNFASAMAFRVVLALVPFLLFVLAVLGVVDQPERRVRGVPAQLRPSTRCWRRRSCGGSRSVSP